MATTMRKNRQMTLNHRNLSIRVSHDVREVDEVDEACERGRQKIRLMNHRWKQMIRTNLSIHQMAPLSNRRMKVTPSNRVRQPHVVLLCVLHVNRKIHLMLSLRKTRQIHQNYRVNRKIHRTSQLQSDCRKSLLRPERPSILNEPISLQTSHLFNLSPSYCADNANTQGKALCNDKGDCIVCQIKRLG